MSSTKIENIDEVHELTEEERLLIEEGIKSVELHGTIPLEEIKAWTDSWGTENALPKPKARKSSVSS